MRGVPLVVRASDERWREVEFALIDAAGERALESELYSPAPARHLVAPGRYEVEVRDFLRVHRKGGTPCPRCGSTISEISPGGFVTSWCRTCQR